MVETSMSEQLSKDEKIKEEVVRTAMDLFMRYGFFKTTMEDIAKAAGKGKSTLYYYYKNKDQIFEAVIRVEVLNAMQKIREAVNKASTASAKMKVYFKTSIAIMRSRILLYDIIKNEIKSSEHYFSVVHKAKQLIGINEVGIIKELLQDGRSSGEFVQMTDEEQESIAIAIIKSTRSICMDLFVLEEPMLGGWEKSLEFMLNIFIRGLKAKQD